VKLFLSGILVALLALVAVQVTATTGVLWRYYDVRLLLRNGQYDRVLAQGCEPIREQLPAVRCPFWITP
jgi:hypothetical protein